MMMYIISHYNENTYSEDQAKISKMKNRKFQILFQVPCLNCELIII